MSATILSHHFTQQKKPNVAQSHDHLKSVKDQQPITYTTTTPITPNSRSELARLARVGTIGWEKESDEEVLLRKFDMDMAFGPNIGLSRQERWERAQSLQLNPPPYIMEILNEQQFLSKSIYESELKNGKIVQELVKDPNDQSQPRASNKGVESHSFFHTHV